MVEKITPNSAIFPKNFLTLSTENFFDGKYTLCHSNTTTRSRYPICIWPYRVINLGFIVLISRMNGNNCLGILRPNAFFAISSSYTKQYLSLSFFSIVCDN